MWEYWKEKYGIVGAIERQYPELMSDPLVMVTMVQIKAFEAVLDTHMTGIDGEKDDG